MNLLAIIGSLVLLLILAAPVWGLSVDQVIQLKKAGVSARLIQALIRAEMEATRQGGAEGRYVVKQDLGRATVVYQASSPRGVSDYLPWQGEASQNTLDWSRVGAALDTGNKTITRPPKFGYALHLASFQKSANAQTGLARLKGKGLDARLKSVYLGEKGRWQRLLVGSYATKTLAQAEGRRLQAQGLIGNFRVLTD